MQKGIVERTPHADPRREVIPGFDGDFNVHRAKERTTATHTAQTLPSLTTLRAFAAVFVAVHHTRTLWTHSALTDWMGHIGFLGVTLFFVLSGFVLMWTFRRRMPTHEFIVRRLIRIYPLHLFCLCTVLLIARCGGPVPGIRGTPWWGTGLNFALVHDWVPGHPNVRQGWNGVSWSLSAELFFYVVAPVLFVFLLRSRRSAFAILAVLWATITALTAIAVWQSWGAVLDFVAFHPVPSLLEFALGAFGAILVRDGRRFASPLIALAVLFLPISLYCAAFGEAGGYQSGAMMNLLFAPGALLLILALASADLEGKQRWMRSNPSSTVGCGWTELSF